MSKRSLTAGIYPSLFSSLGASEFTFQKLIQIKLEEEFIMLDRTESTPQEQYLGGGLINSNSNMKIEYDYIPDKKNSVSQVVQPKPKKEFLPLSESVVDDHYLTKLEERPFEVIEEADSSKDQEESEAEDKGQKKRKKKHSPKNDTLKQNYADLINFARINEDIEKQFVRNIGSSFSIPRIGSDTLGSVKQSLRDSFYGGANTTRTIQGPCMMQNEEAKENYEVLTPSDTPSLA